MTMNNLKFAAGLRLLAEAFETPAESVPQPQPASLPTAAAAPKPRGRGRPVAGEAAPVAAAVSAEPSTAPTVTASVAPDPLDVVPAAPTATLDDVRAVLVKLREATSQENALAVLAKAGDGVTNLASLKPSHYGAVVAAAKLHATPVAADPFDDVNPATAPAAAPAVKQPTIEDVRKICIETQKRTAVDTVQKIVMKHGGKAPDPSGVGEKPSFNSLSPTAFAAVIAELQALPTTK